MHELAHDFTARKVSPWGGMKYFYGTYRRSGMRERLEDVPLPQPGSNRGYCPVDLIEGFMCSVVLGSKRIAHTGMIRADEVLREIFGWKRGMGDQSTFSRFFKKHTVELNDRIFPSLMKSWFEQIAMDRMTIDIDSTVITRYGEQECAEVGYNPTKRGRRSHHPILAFCDELAMVVNSWMRTGDSVSVTDADRFLQEVFTIVPIDRIGLMRFDAGFYSNEIMRLLELQSPSVNYIVRAKMTAGIKTLIQSQRDWVTNDDVMEGAEYCIATYQAKSWDCPRRVVLVRTLKEDWTTEQGNLFEKEAEFEAYDHKAFVTNITLSAIQVHRLYNQRGNAENRIKELKYDYGIEGFAMQNFGAMEAAFRYVMLAYNIMAAFKQWVMRSPKGKMLSTIRFQCIAIGSYLITRGRGKRLQLSAVGHRRHFLEHFFSNLELLKPPFRFSNA